VRELENALERAVVLARDETIGADAFLEPARRLDLPVPAAAEPARAPASLKEAIDAAERDAVTHALEVSGGNRGEAARILGVSLRTLYYKLRQLGLG
jgi:DNA-binding NtrC family response regulator